MQYANTVSTGASTTLAWWAGWVLVALGLAMPAAAQISPAPYLTAYRYLDGGLLAGTISPAPSGQSNFLAVRNTYDSNMRLQTVETGYLAAWPDSVAGFTPVPPSSWGSYTTFSVSKTVRYGYDAYGRKVLETVQGSDGVTTQVTQYSYDVYNNLLCTAVRMNPAVFSSPPDACSLGQTGPNGPDRITRNAYDSLNSVIQVRRAVGTADEEAYATYSYTADGMREYTIDAKGNRSKETYDGYDRLNGLYFPSPATPTAFNPSDAAHALATAGANSTTDFESYVEDNNGNRTSLKKRDNETIAYQIDALNRIWRKDVPGSTGSVYYGYDLRGLQTYARFGSTSGAGISNAYDGFGRQISSTNTMGGVSRSIGHNYDADGNRTGVTHPDGTYFIYDYDGIDRFGDIKENGSPIIVGQTYRPIGTQWTQTRAGVTSTYAYDPVERPQSWADNLAGTAPDVTTTFGYNAANQIITRTRDNDTYAYTEYANGTTSYAPANGLNQYTSVGGMTFSYDANGDLKFDGSTTYTYDAENRVLTASGTTYSATLTYDPLGRLFQVVAGGNTTQFLYDGDELVAEYDSSGTLRRRYVHGPLADDPLIWYEGASVSSASRRSLQSDYQGSILSVADASGNAISINRYDEYGKPASSNIGRFQYTGQAWLSELGLYYYKARFYDPRLGRFLQTDPVGYQDDLNLYAYVYNDPVDRKDPTGMTCNQDRTTCTSNTYDFNRAKSSGVNVRHDSNVDDAVVAARGDYQKPTKKNGEPTGLAKVTDDGVKVTPTESKAGQTLTADTATVKIADGDALVHGHLGGTVADDPASNRGYGDTESLKAKKPTYTVEGNRVGVHDAPHGHLRFHMVSGSMTPAEARAMQENLDREQKLFQ